jgi:hypothetical protein
MFGWLKSKELVTVVSKEKDIQVLVVNNARVRKIWSTDHMIEFEYEEKDYGLKGAHLLKQVCRAYYKANEGDEIYFSAVLTIKGNKIISVNRPETM